MKCVICKNEIKADPDGWAGGHNPEPVKEGRCCGYCNSNVVVPTRLDNFFKTKKENIN